MKTLALNVFDRVFNNPKTSIVGLMLLILLLNKLGVSNDQITAAFAFAGSLFGLLATDSSSTNSKTELNQLQETMQEMHTFLAKTTSGQSEEETTQEGNKNENQ